MTVKAPYDPVLLAAKVALAQVMASDGIATPESAQFATDNYEVLDRVMDLLIEATSAGSPEPPLYVWKEIRGHVEIVAQTMPDSLDGVWEDSKLTIRFTCEKLDQPWRQIPAILKPRKVRAIKIMLKGEKLVFSSLSSLSVEECHAGQWVGYLAELASEAVERGRAALAQSEQRFSPVDDNELFQDEANG